MTSLLGPPRSKSRARARLARAVLASLAPFAAGSTVMLAGPAASAESAAPGPSLANSLTGAAKSDYDAGKLLFSARDYAGSEVKFASAYDRSKDARLLYNMAACEKGLKHYARAIDLLRRYEAEGKEKLPAADVEEADRLIDTFRSFVGTVSVAATEAGATVTLDDDPVGTTPLAKALAVDLGEHRLRVVKPGFVPYETRVRISGPARVAVDATLTREVHEGLVTLHAASNAAIALDGKIVATGDWTAHIPSGGHTLTVTAEGMTTFQSELLVEDGRDRVVTVSLDPLPRRGIPPWVLVAGGVVLATGAVVAAVAVYRTYSPLQQQAIMGSDPGLAKTSIRF